MNRLMNTSEKTALNILCGITTPAHWKNLLDGTVDTLHVKEFATTAECAQLVQFILNNPRTETYKSAKGISRLGSSLNDVRKTGNVLEAYSKPDILEDALLINNVMARVFGTIAA